MKSSRKFTLFALALLAFVATSHSTSAATPAPLPPAAEEAVNKGILAAKVPDYLLAIRYFEEARKAAPQAPVIYLNLGLAESKIPGRELRAMAWFGAYLAAYPEAPNAAAVKEQIAVLEVRNQSNTSRFLKTVQAAASQIPNAENDRDFALWNLATLSLDSGDVATAQINADLIRPATIKTRALMDIAEEKIKAGDLAGAKSTLALALKSADLIDTEPSLGIQSAAWQKRDRLASIASAQAKSGDIAGAQKTADLIRGTEYAYEKSRAQTAIAEAQIEAGDIAGAQNTLASALKTADLIETAYYKRFAQSAIAEVKIKAGDIAGAQNTLASARINAGLIEEADSKSLALTAIAEAQTKSGDIVDALKTLALSQEIAGSINDADGKSRAHTFIAQVQIKAGDMAGAKKSLTSAQGFAELIQGESYGKNWALSELAQAQARSGNLADAQKTADLVQDASQKLFAQRVIDEAQAKASNAKATTRPSPPPSYWLKKLDDDNKINDCPLNTAPFLDLTAYLQSLPPSDNPHQVFKALHEAAKSMVSAQNVIHQMMKQQATR